MLFYLVEIGERCSWSFHHVLANTVDLQVFLSASILFVLIHAVISLSYSRHLRRVSFRGGHIFSIHQLMSTSATIKTINDLANVTVSALRIQSNGRWLIDFLSIGWQHRLLRPSWGTRSLRGLSFTLSCIVDGD